MVLKLAAAILCLIPIALQAAPRQSQPAGPARAWLRSLTPRQRAAQLLMVHFYGDSPHIATDQYRELAALVRDSHIGGLIVLNRIKYGTVQRANVYEMAAFLNRMQALARVPLIVGGDFERASSMRMTPSVQFPHLMAYGAANDPALTHALGRATAREARAMGVHWIFAPDADVNNNPDNPIINIRSFGEDPALVAAHVRAFIEGARSDPKSPVLTTVKHFPGHGDTATDSHIGLATVPASLDRLNDVELVPFKAAIEAQVDSIMTAHLSLPALEPDPIPATVSRRIMTGLLRDELGFKGILTTDAMDMAGLTKLYDPGEAAVRALLAGVDLLLVPRNPVQTLDAIMAAVRSGRLSQKRIDESALRILQAKVKVGLHRSKSVRLEAIPEALPDPDDDRSALQAAQKAITLVKNDNGIVPLKDPASACWFVLSSGRSSTQGRDIMDSIARRLKQPRVTLLDPLLPPAEFDAHAAKAADCASIVVAAYVTSSAYRGNVSLAGHYPAFVEKLIATSKPVVFLSLGNPYLLRAHPAVAAYLAAYSTTAPSEEASVAALLGETSIEGSLPVSIPGLATRGFGIKIRRPD